MLGTVIMNIKSGGWQGVRISPDRKWINLGGHDFIYLLDEKDHLVDPQGKEVPFRVGEDFLRVSYQDGDPKKGIDYQYLLRRVAFKDAKGQLQKTPIYEQLLDQATRPTAPYGACCNLFLCNLSDEERLGHLATCYPFGGTLLTSHIFSKAFLRASTGCSQLIQTSFPILDSIFCPPPPQTKINRKNNHAKLGANRS